MNPGENLATCPTIIFLPVRFSAAIIFLQSSRVSAKGFSDIAFVGFGGEPFTAYADHMRAVAPGSFVITSCITNGGMGYLATEEAYVEGGYESRSSRFTGSLPHDLWGAAEDMFKKYGVK